MASKPNLKPGRPWFSAGPTAKRPGWSSQAISHELLGRGIRAPEVVERFAHGLRLTRELLQVPADWVLVYVPGSDTGAVEAAMWSMLGERPVQVLAFENFGKVWATDAVEHLKLNPEVIAAPWGEWPDTSGVDPAKDLVFPWNGTTAGVRAPNADFIALDREGLVICDATSAAFAMPLPWDRLDVVTFSFQKALGGEAGLGVAALSPRAVARLDHYEPPRPVPKVLRLRDGKGFDRLLATGSMLNTFSVWTLEDWIDAVEWGLAVGGLEALIARTDANAAVLEAWVRRTDWIDYLARDPATRSTTSVCLKIVDPRVTAMPEAARQALVTRMKALVEGEGAAFDIESHRNAPAGLRIWCGCTVETADVEALTPWLDWAFETALAE
ncbi:MAG: phosphoserine transaminase [Alphaproteobacteria bacterium]|jgi:phosphoserine aminotransferase|nr:phosphoserine transaminase [Alphaproteobacteria bacterium]MBU2040528.1 phosphoserine transaminase [Alphaproteobacteria bacterium]MBU2126580.1 phosphoserine transaminase [Alphaproteobacteria bacterium]MBU2207387.1 phosphoserine transaminase [Alphaproteobacteria bacterium]MBU2290245.1 phosphoserine transaminase [Alphaproteobacteria bacterium]